MILRTVMVMVFYSLQDNIKMAITILCVDCRRIWDIRSASTIVSPFWHYLWFSIHTLCIITYCIRNENICTAIKLFKYLRSIKNGLDLIGCLRQHTQLTLAGWPYHTIMKTEDNRKENRKKQSPCKPLATQQKQNDVHRKKKRMDNTHVHRLPNVEICLRVL